jgi:glycerol uptake facilitator-like aquaporin
MAEFAAEFLGTMVFIIFGCGVIANVVIAENSTASPGGPRGVSVCGYRAYFISSQFACKL